MAPALNTKEVGTTQPIDNGQVTAIALEAHSDQTMVEEKPFKRLKIRVSSFPTSTIDLTNFDVEEGGTSPMAVTEEVDDGNNLQAFMNLFSGSNRKSSSVLESTQSTRGSYAFSSTLLLSSIQPLSAFLVGSTFSLPSS